MKGNRYLGLLAAFAVLAASPSAQEIRNDPPHKTATAESSILYPGSFRPQINDRFVLHPVRPENPDPPIEIGLSRSPLSQLGGTMAEQRAHLLAKYPGIDATGWVPPDPTLGVGPSHVIITVNSSIAFFEKGTGAKVFQQTFSDFFSGLWESNFIFDPKVFYDKGSGRFFVIVLEQNDNPRISALLIAVSATSNPTGAWHRYRVNVRDTVGGVDSWFDYPGWGYNKDAIVTTGNMFSFSSSFTGIQFVSIRKAELLTGDAAVVNKWLYTNQGGSVQVAETHDLAQPVVYAVNAPTTSTMRLWAVTDPAGTPAITNTSVTVPQWTIANAAAPSTNGRFLDVVGNRIMNAAFRNGTLVTNHTVTGSGDSRNRVRWYAFNTGSWPTSGSPTLQQSGDILGGDGEHFFMGSVTMNKHGDIASIFTRSSTSIVADIMMSGRVSGDPAGYMGAPSLMESSAGASYTNTSGTKRWGDYSMITVDPTDDTTFWGVHMSGNATGGWRTSFFRFWVSVQLQRLTLREAERIGGQPGQGTVRLVGPAPAGGAIVDITTDPASAASANPTVTVPQNVWAANFPIATHGVDTDTWVRIVASYNSATDTKWLLVKRAKLSQLFGTTQIVGGRNGTMSVYLNGLAGPAGALVTLASDNPAVLQVPASVRVQAQRSRFDFTYTTKGVAANTLVTISGTFRNETKIRHVIVTPARLEYLTVQSPTITGGQSMTGTLRFNGQTPPGGALVTMASSDPAASVPASVSVPAFVDRRNFTINTSPVTAPTPVTIEGTYQGITRSISITVMP
jgi:hypothetical protein